jgi:hypothetical protein
MASAWSARRRKRDGIIIVVLLRGGRWIGAPGGASSPLAATMTALARPIHYVAGNGSAEFRVIGF